MYKKNFLIIMVLALLLMAGSSFAQHQSFQGKVKDGQTKVVDTRIDNMSYWKTLAAEGVIPVEPNHYYRPAYETGSKIVAFSVITEDSEDIPVSDATNITESENSIFVNPADDQFILNSNNSTSWNGSSVGTLYGANYFYSGDAGLSWGGSAQGAGGGNSGDPATAINLDGSRMYVNYIANNYGMGVANSTDGGNSWTHVQAAPNPGSLADKNHMWIDNVSTSPYEGNIYVAYTDFGGSNDSDIALVYSTNGGLNWSSVENISQGIAGGGHCQGVHISTGPNGEVYVFWAIYTSWPADESAIGMSKSTDGGGSWSTPVKIIDNIRGIRTSETSKNHRVNSFPVSACDIVGGNVYVTWTNIGVPGINTGSDIDVYLIRSENGGTSWSTPVKVNQDDAGLGHEHYFSWITCDPVTGAISAVFYDDRNVGGSQCEVYCANSFDGGDTWEDFKVSDVAFTPSPIPGLAGGYMGDYLGITSYGGYVYPCWTDNRGSTYMTYVSPYLTNNLPRPADLVIELDEVSGATTLTWTYDESKDFQFFNVYRGEELLGTTTDLTYSDNLPDYGVYTYKVTAMHDEGESAPVSGSIQWGNPHIYVNPLEIVTGLAPGESTVEIVTITNIGELDLTYDISPLINTDKSRDYCDASGGCDEFISRVEIGDINNSSSCDGYADYTDLSTIVNSGETYQLTIDNGNVYSSDDNGVWVDWNQDGDFDDEGENVVCDPDNGAASLTYDILIPETALAGETTMRIRMKYYDSDCGSPCGTTSYGEVEDYTLIVQGWLFIDPMEGTIAAGDSQEIAVTLDAADLLEGTYTASLNIESDDPDLPLVNVPITLIVSENLPLVVAMADPDTVCYGGSSQLSATGEGGTGTYTYSWTSVPEGFTSDEQNPVFENIMEETTFTVEMNDGNLTVYANAVVSVNPLPEVTFELEIDTLCVFYSPVILSEGLPVDGVYSGEGVSEDNGDYYFDPAEAGIGEHTITYTYEDDNGCVNSAEDIMIVDECLGMSEYSNGMYLQVFPNPNNGIFTMKIQSQENTVSEVRVFNSIGVEVYYQSNVAINGTFTGDFDLSQNPEGLYFVNVISENINIVKKVILRK